MTDKWLGITPGYIRDQLKCGGCGGADHRLFNIRWEPDSRQTIHRIQVECIACGSVSEFKASIHQFIEPVSGGGTLCGGW